MNFVGFMEVTYLDKESPRVITISGKAGAGKDTFARFLKRSLEEQGKKVLVAHYADLLKYICMMFFAWDGKKDALGRRLLQTVGTDIVRRQDKDYWVNFMIDILGFFGFMWDYVLLPDARFDNEIDLVSKVYDTESVLIKRDFDSQLTEAAQAHQSENALDGYGFDLIVHNRTLEGLSEAAEVVSQYLITGHWSIDLPV